MTLKHGATAPASPTGGTPDLTAKVRHYNATLVAEFGELRVSDEESAELLRALVAEFGSKPFDEVNIASCSHRVASRGSHLPLSRTRVHRALEPIGWWRSAGERDIVRWLLAVTGKNIAGLRLERDVAGWCRIISQ